MPVIKRARKARKVVAHRCRRNPTSVMAVNPSRRKARKVVARKTYKRRTNPAELLELAMNPKRKARRVYRKTRKVYPRGTRRANPRGIKVTPKQKQRIRKYAKRRYGARAVARKMGLSQSEMYRISKFVRGKHKKFYHRRKTSKKARTYKRRRTQSLKFKVPSGAKYGALKVAFNPAFSWAQLKSGATAGLWGVGGFAASSFLTNAIGPKIGTGLNIGPVSTKTVVATLIAAAVPFLPVHFKGKDNLIAGCWINAFARLAKDVLPENMGITQYLPATLGDFSQLAVYQPNAMGDMAAYTPLMSTYQPNVAQYGPPREGEMGVETDGLGDSVNGDMPWSE
jgi:hypothetical protein